jgi:N-acetylglucosamine-6-sulfatase
MSVTARPPSSLAPVHHKGAVALLFAALYAVLVPAIVNGDVGTAALDQLPGHGTPGAIHSSGRLEPPNIVLVMADDMRADDLRFMPRVRQLIAARGLTFRNSFSPYPLCCPARASLLTGQYPHNHGVLHNREPWGFAAFDDRATLATSLRAAGYRTGFVGKYLNHYGLAPSLVTGAPSLTYVPPGWTDWFAAVEPPPGSAYSGGTYDYFDTVFNVNGTTDDSHRGQYQTAVLGRFSRSLVRTYARGDQPFFLFLSALAPHTGFPIEPDDPAWQGERDGRRHSLATPARPSWVEGAFDASLTRSPGLPVDGSSPEADVTDKPAAVRRPPLSSVEEDAVLELARQRAEALLVLDVEIGRIVDTLSRTGALANTVLMFTSDNGYFLGEHRQPFAKTLPYEPSLRVPFVISGPGVPVGERFDPARTTDLTATILDLADASPPHPADGSSLLATIHSGDRGWTAPVLTEALVKGVSGGPPAVLASRGFTDALNVIGVRTARYKLVRWATGAVELYDLAMDPNELHNLAHEPGHRAVRRQLTNVWWHYKDCRAAACSRPLPAALRLAPRALAALTESEAAGVRAVFGVSW